MALLAILPASAAAAAESPSPAAPAAAPDAASPSAGDDWEHQVALYLAAVGMSGDAAVGRLGVDVDLPFSEILDHLDAGAMAAYRGSKGNWAVMANGVFFSLGASKDLPLGGDGDAEINQTLFELDGARRFAKGLEFYFGARVVDIDSSLELNVVVGTDIEGNPIFQTTEGNKRKTWLDPLVGLRYQVSMGKHWAFVGRADVGGFGLGSDLAWQAMAHFDWRISKHFGAAFGYVILDIDYDDGEGSHYFLYDIAAQGPLAAATFHF